MTKAELYREYQAKRTKIKDAVNALKVTKDSNEKFERLIRLTTDFEAYVVDTQLKGLKQAKSHPYNSQKWVDAYYAFKNKPKPKPKPKKSTINQKKDFSISLCWTIKPDYCVCEGIIAKIQKYFETIKISSTDITRTEFPDRIEFCETYRLKCTKEKFDLILKSAEYLLDITTESAYDKCNMGIFGQQL